MRCAIYDSSKKKEFFSLFDNKQITYYPHMNRLYANTPGGPVLVEEGQGVAVSNNVVSVVGHDLAVQIIAAEEAIHGRVSNKGTRKDISENERESEGSDRPGELTIKPEEDRGIRSESNTGSNKTREGSVSRRRRRVQSRPACREYQETKEDQKSVSLHESVEVELNNVREDAICNIP